ncbi:uroporphyrinogen III methyltransferase / synthase [Pseudobutyrivibrio ruminis]|uniref:uroporphyrinogen-III C-methyltransferase n=1 Tax=Pseudobutyrivibrio ruminis TaxID=46206 RepID=A0A1H7K4G9_9FIRM|nr:uroporphyrinogen-III C-methyltransferase [Pseudobutyrivibrio ruminis]SEK81350.1 uroporphyrinogen III methyltransferase / synthase [Pseudobutyrivibrio ruminis]
MSEQKKVVLVGAGPGEWGLLTLKGAEYLKRADCVIYDRLLNKKFLEMTPDGCEKIFVGKENHNHTMKQENINELLYEKSKEYNLVVRLKGGDSYVFGRGGEEALYLLERGVDVEVVSGVTSPIAALSAAGIPITHRGLAKGFQVITAHSRKDEAADIDYSQLLEEDVTLVFLMGLSHVGEIAEGLINAGRSPKTPAAVISNATTNKQRKCVGTLADISDLVEKANLVSPSIIVVGDVVTLSDRLSLFEKRPLFGKRYFLPKIIGFNYGFGEKFSYEKTNKLEEQLIQLGAQVYTVDSGKIVPLEIDLGFLELTQPSDYIVFTSANGVKAFFYNLYEVCQKDIRSIGPVKIAAIGAKTASALESFGVRVDLISEAQNGKDLALKISEKIASGGRVYWLCASNMSEDFEANLDNRIPLNKIPVYKNEKLEVSITDSDLEEISSYDGAVFTSASNALFGAEVLGDKMPQQIFAIGNACKRAISDRYDNISVAEISSYEGLLDLIKNYTISTHCI